MLKGFDELRYIQYPPYFSRISNGRLPVETGMIVIPDDVKYIAITSKNSNGIDNSPYMIISTIAALLKTITHVVKKVPDSKGKEHIIPNIPLLSQYFMLTNPGKRTIGTLHSMWEKFLDKVPALKVL